MAFTYGRSDTSDNLKKIREVLAGIEKMTQKPKHAEKPTYTQTGHFQSLDDAMNKLKQARDESACKHLQEFAKDRASNDLLAKYAVLDLTNDPSYHHRCVDNKGYTPVMNALSNNNKEALKVLTSHGFDVNHAVKDGKTMLHLAVDKLLLQAHDSDRMVEGLLTLGADYSILDSAGHKALDPLLIKHFSQPSWSEGLALFNKEAAAFSEYSPNLYNAIGQELHAKVDADLSQMHFHDEM